MLQTEEKRENRLSAEARQKTNSSWLPVFIGFLLVFGLSYAVRDVGVTKIVAPAATIDSGHSVAPACSVYNFGTVTEAYAVRVKIGGSYDNTATVTSHSPGTYRYVTFPVWTATPLGTTIVLCSTQLVSDSTPANNKRTRPTYVWSWPFGQIYVKVGVQGILNGAPISGTGSGMIDTAALFPSALWTYYDTVPADFHPFLTMLPGPLEAESGAINLWQLCGGNLNAIRAYTWPSHPADTVGVGFYSVLVGCTLKVGIGILGQWPDDTGWDRDLVPCEMHWTQQDSMTVSEQGTLGYIRASGETLLTNVSTTYSGTRRRLLGPEVSKTYFPFDAYSNRLSSTCWWGRSMPENHGRQIDIRGSINGTVNGQPVFGREWGMLDTTGLHSGCAYLYFDTLAISPVTALWPDWLCCRSGCATRSARVLNLWSLSGGNLDMTRTLVFPSAPGDTLSGSSTVRSAGLSLHFTSQILGTYSGPQDLASWKSEIAQWNQVNPTTVSDRGRASALRSAGDSVVGTFTSLFSNLSRQLSFDQTLNVSFPQCRTAHGFLALTWTGILDSVPAAPSPGWKQLASVPAGPKNKNVKDGGCLAGFQRSDTDFVYALKGNNTCEFYRYCAATNAWTTLESIPAIGSTGKKRAVKKGAASAKAVPDGCIQPECWHYCAKGNGTLEFWRYTPGGTPYPWQEEARVPSGAKTIKEGAGLTFMQGDGDTGWHWPPSRSIYLLKGSGTQEFYRYNIAANIWRRMADAPLGTSGKTWKKGSAICCVPDDHPWDRAIYALKGGYNEFYAYDCSTNTWTTLPSLPFIGSSGKKKKAGDGAGIAWSGGYVHALKGNNTLEFYTMPDDSPLWRPADDMPLGGGKRVKGGGALTFARPMTGGSGGYLYALKGNNTLEFYRYVPPTRAFGSQFAAISPNSSASSSLRLSPFAVSIAPNPFSRATTITYFLPKPGEMSLRLFDVSGRLVATLATGHCEAGEHSIAVGRPLLLAGGVYLLQFRTEDHRETRKLIME